MLFIKGEDLSDYIQQKGRFPEREGLSVAIGIAEGIVHLHQHGIVHRDLKTGNIMRCADGTPVIIDLGLSSVQRRAAGSGGSQTISQLANTLASTRISDQTDATKGTPLWMAPEMISNQEWSDKTDVYAFGIIMWEIFSRKKLFEESAANSLKRLLSDIVTDTRPTLAHVSHIDHHLTDLMQQCWRSQAQNRPKMQRVLDVLRGNDAREIFKKVDDNGDGKLSFAEFVPFMSKYCPGTVEDKDMHGVFQAIDKDRSGTIEVEEFEVFWEDVSKMGLETCLSKSLKKSEIMQSIMIGKRAAMPKGGGGTGEEVQSSCAVQ